MVSEDWRGINRRSPKQAYVRRSDVTNGYILDVDSPRFVRETHPSSSTEVCTRTECGVGVSRCGGGYEPFLGQVPVCGGSYVRPKGQLADVD